MPHLFFLFICVVWGASFILMDRAALAFGPVTIGLWRLLGGAAVVLLYCLIKRQRARLKPSDYVHGLVVGFCSNALPFVLQPYVMHEAGEHAYFGLMVAFVPLVTILVSMPMLGIRPTPRQLVGVLGGLACLWLIVSDGQHRGIGPWLLALAVAVPVAYAIGNTYIRWKLNHLPTAPLTLLYLAFGSLILLPIKCSPAALQAMHVADPVAPEQYPLAITSLAILSVLGTGVAVLMFTHLIKTQGPLFAGMVTYVVPILALVWGQFDGEELTSRQIVGVVGILAMVALVQWRAAVPVAIGPKAASSR